MACEPTLEGVLVATGLSYLAHAMPDRIRLASCHHLQAQLGEEVVEVGSSSEGEVAFGRRVLAGFSRRVTQGCRRRRKTGGCSADCDNACVRRLVIAAASDDESMPDVVYRYLRLGFDVGPKVRNLIADPRVAAFNDIARYVLGECEHTQQFVRFSHMSDGSYFATFSPNANTIPFTAAHFAARMGPQRFCLVDPKHCIAAFHGEGERRCTITLLDRRLANELASRNDIADDEHYVREMWRRFYGGTTTPGRERSQRGYDLRASWMPLRLWAGLTELEPSGVEGDVPLLIPDRYAG